MSWGTPRRSRALHIPQYIQRPPPVAVPASPLDDTAEDDARQWRLWQGREARRKEDACSAAAAPARARERVRSAETIEESAPEPAPAPAPGNASRAPATALERFQNLQGFKRKASAAPRKRLPNHDAVLKEYRGQFPEERIKNLVLTHRIAPQGAHASEDEQVDEIVCLLAQALTTSRPEWHDLRSFFAFVQTEEDYNVQGVLCEDILQWDVKVDDPKRLQKAVVAFYETLQALATSVLHDC